jgi:hypothetical protein
LLAGVLATKAWAAGFKVRVPVGRRLKVLTLLPVGTEAVVGGALLRVFQHLVGFPQLLEALLRVARLADVGMVFARELPVGAFDLVLGGVARHAHHLVVVLEFHAHPPLDGSLYSGCGRAIAREAAEGAV